MVHTSVMGRETEVCCQISTVLNSTRKGEIYQVLRDEEEMSLIHIHIYMCMSPVATSRWSGGLN
jgi:hypothetical protein